MDPLRREPSSLNRMEEEIKSPTTDRSDPLGETANKVTETTSGIPGPKLGGTSSPRLSNNVTTGNIPTSITTKLDLMIKMKMVQPDEKDKILSKLEAVYNQPLPTPKIRSMDPEAKAILLRGCKADQLIKILQSDSAGGEPVNKDTSRPTEKQAILQVGEAVSLPEFTLSEEVANGFGTGTFICAFAIKMKYLTQGSTVESGWITQKDAPVQLLAVKEGRPFEGLTRSNAKDGSGKNPGIVSRNRSIDPRRTRPMNSAPTFKQTIKEVPTENENM